MEFQAFQKIPRLKRDCVITEKIDGTNAQVHISATSLYEATAPDANVIHTWVDGDNQFEMRAGSRNRWIVPGDDNYGFAAWVKKNAEELQGLGEGAHFGEWWGSGIQRGYGLEKGEKRFSLFNVSRWSANPDRPACCHAVPILYQGEFATNIVDGAVEMLRQYGSVASRGFMRPEGVIIFHVASRELFKVTLEKDEVPKGLAA